MSVKKSCHFIREIIVILNWSNLSSSIHVSSDSTYYSQHNPLPNRTNISFRRVTGGCTQHSYPPYTGPYHTILKKKKMAKPRNLPAAPIASLGAPRTRLPVITLAPPDREDRGPVYGSALDTHTMRSARIPGGRTRTRARAMHCLARVRAKSPRCDARDSFSARARVKVASLSLRAAIFAADVRFERRVLYTRPLLREVGCFGLDDRCVLTLIWLAVPYNVSRGCRKQSVTRCVQGK